MAGTPTSRESIRSIAAPSNISHVALVRTVTMVRTKPPRMDTAATRAMFRAMRKNAFRAEVQKFVEKIAVCRREGGREGVEQIQVQVIATDTRDFSQYHL